ncbi:MAG: response regulator [Treponema sp.]|nr:response regulator [Treponema sp.]
MDEKPKRIIVVDDDITNLNIARNALVQKYDIFTIPSGEKLFQILERIVPDLILLDLEMPNMNGYEVLAALKGKEETAKIPVIFVTATLDAERRQKGIDLGAVDYITKPFNQEHLLDCIAANLS